MTIADKKEILKNYYIQDKKLDAIKELYERRKNQIISPGVQTLTDMPGANSYNKDKIPNAITLLIELETRLAEEQSIIMKQVWKVDEAISRLVCERCREVIELRYCKRLTWDDIAKELYLDKRTVERTHGRALQMIEL